MLNKTRTQSETGLCSGTVRVSAIPKALGCVERVSPERCEKSVVIRSRKVWCDLCITKADGAGGSRSLSHVRRGAPPLRDRDGPAAVEQAFTITVGVRRLFACVDRHGASEVQVSSPEGYASSGSEAEQGGCHPEGARLCEKGQSRKV